MVVVKGSTVDAKFTLVMAIIRNDTTIASSNLCKPEANQYSGKSGWTNVNSNFAYIEP